MEAFCHGNTARVAVPYCGAALQQWLAGYQAGLLLG